MFVKLSFEIVSTRLPRNPRETLELANNSGFLQNNLRLRVIHICEGNVLWKKAHTQSQSVPTALLQCADAMFSVFQVFQGAQIVYT